MAARRAKDSGKPRATACSIIAWARRRRERRPDPHRPDAIVDVASPPPPRRRHRRIRTAPAPGACRSGVTVAVANQGVKDLPMDSAAFGIERTIRSAPVRSAMHPGRHGRHQRDYELSGRVDLHGRILLRPHREQHHVRSGGPVRRCPSSRSRRELRCAPRLSERLDRIKRAGSISPFATADEASAFPSQPLPPMMPILAAMLIERSS